MKQTKQTGGGTLLRMRAAARIHTKQNSGPGETPLPHALARLQLRSGVAGQHASAIRDVAFGIDSPTRAFSENCVAKGQAAMFSTVSKSRTPSARSTETDYLLRILGTPDGEMAVWSGVGAGNDARRDAPGRATPRTWLPVDAKAIAANVDAPFDPWPSTSAIHEAARTRRAAAIASFIDKAANCMREALRTAWIRYRRRREARGIYEALRGLDDRTLRDLGFHRCEIGSVAAEATGAAEHTRMHVHVLPRTPYETH
jgi:uncharacterized protein YjiS (DUF1127 family)